MIVWLVLFLLIIGISFLLAFRSMKDYHEIPQKSKLEYSLYLIRKSSSLSATLLQSIRESLAKRGLVISLERLFKGTESALCIFGPKEILTGYSDLLSLLEIEDYSGDFNGEDTTVWEVNSKAIDNPFADFPNFSNGELFAWQVILSGKLVQIRAGMRSSEPARRKEIEGKFSKLPRPFSNSQMIDFYKERSMDRETAKEISHPKLLAQFLLPQLHPEAHSG